MTWAAVLGGAAGCYLLKLLGLSVPTRWLSGPRTQRIAASLPVALLAGLIATQTLATGHHLTLDSRLPAMAVAALAVARRAPFLLVIMLAAAAAALVRAVL